MLYDRHLMQALFQLQIGNPGSSFAVEIARKIGLPEDVIADASEIVGSEYINADKYLQDIVRSALKKNFPDFDQKEIKIGTFGSTTAQAVRDAGLRLACIKQKKKKSLKGKA